MALVLREDVQLADNFWLSEFLHSELMPEVLTYVPSLQEVANVTRLAHHLQLLRNYGGKPIKITGGARPNSVTRVSDGASFCEVLREAGYPASTTSQHRTFCAADFVMPGSDMLELFQFADMSFPRAVTQLILYENDNGVPFMIHLGIHDYANPTKGKRNPRLVHKGGRYVTAIT